MLKNSVLKQAFEGKVVTQDPDDGPAEVLLKRISKDAEFEKDDLPEGWITVLLSDIATTKSGGTPSRKNPDNFDGNIPWLKSGELNDSYILNSDEKISKHALDNSNATIFSKGTILIAMYGATIGKLGILQINASTNQAICAIQYNEEMVFQDFLFNYLLFKKKSLINLGFGGAQNNISQNIIRMINIVIPPLNEQKRIVAKIESIFTRIDATRERLEALASHIQSSSVSLNALKRSVLKQAFEGKFTKEWKEIKFENVVQKIYKINPKETPNKKFYYCDIQSIDNKLLKIIKPKKIFGKNAPSRARQLIHKNDIIYSTVRTYLRNMAIVPSELDNQLCSTGFCVLRANELIISKFIFYIVQSQNFENYLHPLQRGVAYPAVRTNDILNYQFLLPPLNEQKRIVSKIESIFGRIDAIKKMLKNSLLNMFA